MGTDYFIACRPKKELFELFRGAEWNRLRELLYAPAKKEAFAQGVLDMMLGYMDEGMDEYALAIGRTIWDWCDARDWEVELVHDAVVEEPDWYNWEVTGSRDDPEPEVAAKMSDSQRQEREAMLDDRTALLRVVSDLRLYRAATWRLLEQKDEAGELRREAVEQFEEAVTAIEAGESPSVHLSAQGLKSGRTTT